MSKELHSFAIVLSIIFAALNNCVWALTNSASLDLTQTHSGPIRSHLSADGAVRIWLGIPYAQAPVGELRWQAPRPHAPWTQVLDADAYGAACVQVGWHHGPPPAGKPWGLAVAETFGKPVGDEDCLTLNVWRPVAATAPLPVIVFVHGGANVTGYSGDPIYEAQHLALATQAVVVTINYRLGMMGWFMHPSLEGADAVSNSGNFGTLDIAQALHFVQDNAAAFGGDAHNVTLAGQSAGANNTYSLMGSHLADGLFQKAIVLSGLPPTGISKQDGYDYANEFIAQLAVDDGLAPSMKEAAAYVTGKGTAWQRDYLRHKTAAQLMQAIMAHDKLRKGAHQFHDGTVLSNDLPAAMKRGEYHVVPTLVGMTRSESKALFDVVYKVDGKALFRAMQTSDPDAAPTLTRGDLVDGFLLPDFSAKPYEALHWGMTSWLMGRLNTALAAQAPHNPNLYVYRFDWAGEPEPWNTLVGACHACDLPFVFGNFHNNYFAMNYARRTQPGREALSRVMTGAIAAFIRTGDPNNAGLPLHWPAYGDEHQKLVLDADEQQAVLRVQ